MKINNLNPVNFGANFITNTTIQKYNAKKKSYFPTDVSFVEIDPQNKNDLKALTDAAKYWGNNDSYALNIASAATGIAAEFINAVKNKIYAVTRQTDNFDKLNDQKILCLAHVELEDNQPAELEYLQVNPDMIYTLKEPQYKHIGTGFLNTLKKIYHEAIVLNAAYSAATFYEKNGFKCISPQTLRYIWKP